jgi:hypothetical protein
VARRRSNNALNLTKRDILSVGALRAPSSLKRASQVSAVFDGPTMNWTRTRYDARWPALLVAAFFVIVVERAIAVPTASAAQVPVVSVFAGGTFGPGWWTLEIDRSGMLKTSVVGGSESHSPSRHITGEEQDRLLDLLGHLPTGQAKYSFGRSYSDVSVDFLLRVDTGKAMRQYYVTSSLEEDASRPEVRPILAALHFLHSLVSTKGAIPPPPMEAVVAPQ